jgi:hypothetical protein
LAGGDVVARAERLLEEVDNLPRKRANSADVAFFQVVRAP